MRALAWGAGFGLGHALWIARPRMAEAMPSTFAVLLLALLVVAYLGGRSRRDGSSSATAVAVADARAAAVNQVHVNVYEGARLAASERFGGLDVVERSALAFDLGDDPEVTLADLECDPEALAEYERAVRGQGPQGPPAAPARSDLLRGSSGSD